ncbi:hypothetical protein B0H17DRAFT_1091848 [Mycena rosella]|uniref:Uncharacterized protein n=1 Tax=Mycena rosella TaxID=1033263 RepID=A0AAD7CV41_MYCRO|nr:hypothetical protein B0H17DRAFT_1091848 [Mycena rosella]
MSTIPSNVGAVVAGCMISVGLSAVIGLQNFPIFPSDVRQYELFELIWLTDAAQTGIFCAVAWEYAIIHFRNSHGAAQLQIPVSVLLAVTAVATLSVNLFYGWRIHKSSKKYKWWLSAPIAFLCIARVVLGFGFSASPTPGSVLVIINKTHLVYGAHFGARLAQGLMPFLWLAFFPTYREGASGKPNETG